MNLDNMGLMFKPQKFHEVCSCFGALVSFGTLPDTRLTGSCRHSQTFLDHLLIIFQCRISDHFSGSLNGSDPSPLFLVIIA